MYGTIVVFLMAEIIFSLSPGDGSQQWGLGDDFLSAAFMLMGWLLVRAYFARVKKSPEARRIVLAGSHETTAKVILLVPYALFLYQTSFLGAIVFPLSGVSQFLSTFVGLAPYLAGWILVWGEGTELARAHAHDPRTHVDRIIAHMRMDYPVVAPWFVIIAFEDLLAFAFPGIFKFLDQYPQAYVLYLPAFLLAAAVFVPGFVLRFWGCKDVPPGELRDEIELMVAQTGIKVRRILLWPLHGGKLITAGIMGVAPRLRYLLLTPGILQILTKEQLKAVIAHEAGHVIKHHMLVYLMFFSLLILSATSLIFQAGKLAMLWLGVVYPDLDGFLDSSIVVTVLFMLFVLLVVRVLFGRLSRDFEREADLMSLKIMGSAEPLVQAFDAIAQNSGGLMDLPSWHHGSIAERVAYLRSAEENPSIAEEHFAKQKRQKIRLALVGAGLTALAFWLAMPSVENLLGHRTLEVAIESKIKEDPNNSELWAALGEARLNLGREKDALEALKEAALLDPGNARVYNNIAWTLATSEDDAVNDVATALEFAEQAANLDPSPHILDTLAEARFRSGDIKGAIMAIEEALLSLNPEVDDVEYYLSQKKRFEEALSNSL